MLLCGGYDTDRFDIFAEKCADGVKKLGDGEQGIVLLLNSFKKARFTELFSEKYPEYDENKVKILTLYGLCYNTFKDNEDFIKKLLKYPVYDDINLCGLEVSRFIFSRCIKEADFTDYISKINLLHQLFRRYSLIVQNRFSPNEIKKRSEILNESFYKEANKAIEEYKKLTIKYKSFDYLRQCNVLPLIYENTDYFKRVKFLAADDTDEYSYAFFCFIDSVMQNLNDYVFAYENYGSSRCGYLCAYKDGINRIKNKYAPEEIVLKPKYSNTIYPLVSAIKNDKKFISEKIKHYNLETRGESLDNTIKHIKELLKKNVKPGEICVISPDINDMFSEVFLNNEYNINFQIISGGEKIGDAETPGAILTVLKLANGIKPDLFELKKLLVSVSDIPYKKCREEIKYFEKNGVIKETYEHENIYKDRYKKLVETVKSLKKNNYGLTEQIKIIYENIPGIKRIGEETKKYEFLLKEAEGFEKAFSSDVENITEKFVIQISGGIISENPSEAIALRENSIIVATPQKAVDLGIRSKYCFWLDVSSSGWCKEDTGTIYNACVFSRDFNKETYTSEDLRKFTADKTARLVNKLMRLCEKEIHLYSCKYDEAGRVNTGGLCNFFESKPEEKTVIKIVPRDDQKAVLNYKSGECAVTAVPGSGKTTVLTALTVKLIESGVNPENIYILTYMESAAKTFSDRLKNMLKSGISLPNISTIHGLALGIIKDNANYSLCGLDENFEICDDNMKDAILKELFFKCNIPEDMHENYIKCISAVKPYDSDFNSKYKEIRDFFNFLKEYDKTLKSRNLIDYDDMLGYAIKILKEHKDIREYFQSRCRYIIEDEAQDSTEAQQQLIELLKGKHGNYLRCGDINQSVTSTFTNSNLDGFKNFIKEHSKIEMSTSQRCSKQIYTLANKFLKSALSDDETKNAFYETYMKGNANNPVSKVNPSYICFPSEKDEKKYIIDKIKQIKENNPKADIAILLRLNSHVNDFNETLLASGIETEINTDCICQNKIYRLIFAVLKISLNPENNDNILNLANEYSKAGIKKFDEKEKEYIKKLKVPFITINPEETDNENLEQLYWDIDYLINSLTGNISSNAIKAGEFFASNASEKADVYAAAAFFKRLSAEKHSEAEILKSAEYYSQKPSGIIKLKKEEDSNKVKIMTMHKSKGAEFDIVFIPELNEENYPSTVKNVKLKTGSHFLRTIKNFACNSGIQTVEEEKLALVNENFRLLYVGITRAKKELYMSYSKNSKIGKNMNNHEIISKIINEQNDSCDIII